MFGWQRGFIDVICERRDGFVNRSGYTKRLVHSPLLLILLTLCACKSQDVEDVSAQKIVLTQGKGASKVKRKPRRSKEWFDEQIGVAEQERAQGKIRAAIQRIYKVRDEYPGPGHRKQLDALLHQLNEDVLGLDTIEARVEVQKDPVAFGEPLRLRIHLRNGTGRRVRIPARLKNTSGSVFLLSVVRRDFDIRAHVASRRSRVRRKVASDIDIPAGGSADQVLVLEPEDIGNDKGLDGFRTFTVGGSLRPIVLEIGGLRRWEAIPVKPATVRSFRPNWEPLAKNPLKKLRLALKREWGVHLLTAAALLPNRDRKAAVDLMVGNLRGDRRIDWAMFASLQHLTNLNMGRDAGAWRAWWPRVRTTFFFVPERKPADKPAFD